MVPKVAIIAEVNATATLGHGMRSLAIAAAMQDFTSSQVLFLSEFNEIISSIAKRYGVSYCTLPDLNWHPDSAEAANLITAKKPDVVIVDSLNLSQSWVAAVKESGADVISIGYDGMPAMGADGLVIPDICPKEIQTDCPSICGVEYAPLGPDYWQQNERAKSTSFERILITTGGEDEIRICEKALIALEDVFASTLQIRIVIGSFFDNVEPISKLADDSHHHVELIDAPSGLAELLSWSDFTISGGGGTLLERACLGVSGIAVAIIPAQRPLVSYLGKRGAVIGIEFIGAGLTEALKNALAQLAATPSLINNMSRSGQAIIDGQGARRIAQWIDKLCASDHTLDSRGPILS